MDSGRGLAGLLPEFSCEPIVGWLKAASLFDGRALSGALLVALLVALFAEVPDDSIGALLETPLLD